MLQMKHAAALMVCLTLPLTSGCVTIQAAGTSETERALCRELRRDLPTFSSEDTRDTQKAVAKFSDVFESVFKGRC